MRLPTPVGPPSELSRAILREAAAAGVAVTDTAAGFLLSAAERRDENGDLPPPRDLGRSEGTVRELLDAVVLLTDDVSCWQVRVNPRTSARTLWWMRRVPPNRPPPVSEGCVRVTVSADGWPICADP